MRHFRILALSIIVIASIFGCDNDNNHDIKKFVTDIKNEKPADIKQLPAYIDNKNSNHKASDNLSQNNGDEISGMRLAGYIVGGVSTFGIIEKPDGSFVKVEKNKFIPETKLKIIDILPGKIKLVDVKLTRKELLDHDAESSLQTKLFKKNSLLVVMHHIPISNALRWFAAFGNRNIVIDPSVFGDIDIDLKNISWENAYRMMLLSHQLGDREYDGAIYIATQKVLSDLKKNSDMKTEVINLQYARAESLAKTIENNNHGFISKDGCIAADKRTNSLVIRDSVDDWPILKRYIKNLDRPAKQVLIEAEIVNLDESYERKLGLKFGFPVQHIFNGSSNSVNNTGGNGLILLGSSQEILNIELEALENEGKAKIISRPRLLTQNGEKATIESGQEIPYEQSVAQGVTSTTFKKAVLSLSVTPEVLPNKTILLSLTANQDKPSDLTVKGVPAVDTQKIETMVMIKSGETVVLGGIHERTQGTTEKNVPVLSKIPAIGLLFSNKKTVNDRRELLIFVTPKIVSGK